MDRKYSLETQKEINAVLANVSEWKNLFSIKVDFFYEGWAIYLKEKSIYPRSIVIFKSYSETHYSIRSFEIHTTDEKEVFKELYFKEKIETNTELYSEIKEVIYGKDILGSISRIKYD
ncbi:MAG: hypothetical protein ACFE96_04440 [Candidatus Hermodarchaeota archaeon]